MTTHQLLDINDEKVVIIHVDEYASTKKAESWASYARMYADVYWLHCGVNLVILELNDRTFFAGKHTFPGGEYDKLLEKRAALTQ